jgi:translation initiation factor 1
VSYLPPERQTARVAQERRKKGKSVTVIRGLRAQESDLAALLKLLKTACGAGGTLNEETLEIQGDQVHRIENWLREKGYRVRS